MSVKKSVQGYWTVILNESGLVMFKSLSRKNCSDWLAMYTQEVSSDEVEE